MKKTKSHLTAYCLMYLEAGATKEKIRGYVAEKLQVSDQTFEKAFHIAQTLSNALDDIRKEQLEELRAEMRRQQAFLPKK